MQLMPKLRNPVVEDRPESAAPDAVESDACSTTTTSYWAGAMNRTFSQIAQLRATTIGVTGVRRGMGASLAARELAAAYRRFGCKVFLMDAEAEAREMAWTLAGTSPAFSKAGAPSLEQLAGAFRARLDQIRKTTGSIIIDLPPVEAMPGQPDPAFIAAGKHCDLVLLICRTGAVTLAEIKQCQTTCSAAEVKLGGLLLNDSDVPLSRLL